MLISASLSSQKAGIPAEHLDGSANKAERRRALAALRAGDTALLCSVSLLSEGFDEPSVDAVLLARPTLSKALYLQQVGRGLRSCPATGKLDCVVLDMACNTLQHGCVTGPPWYTPEAGMWRCFLDRPQLQACQRLTAAVNRDSFKPLLKQLRSGSRSFATMPGVITVPSARGGSARDAKPADAPPSGVARCVKGGCSHLQHAAIEKCFCCGSQTNIVQWSREGGVGGAAAIAAVPRKAPAHPTAHKAATAAAIAAVPRKAPAHPTTHKAATAAAIAAVPRKAPAHPTAHKAATAAAIAAVPRKAPTAHKAPLAKQHVNTASTAAQRRPQFSKQRHRAQSSGGALPHTAQADEGPPSGDGGGAPREATTLG